MPFSIFSLSKIPLSQLTFEIPFLRKICKEYDSIDKNKFQKWYIALKGSQSQKTSNCAS